VKRGDRRLGERRQEIKREKTNFNTARLSPHPPTLGESNLVKVTSIGDLGADRIKLESLTEQY